MTLPNFAFLAVLLGLLLLYCEFVWIGRIYFGLAGALLILTGLAGLRNLPHTALGLWLVGGACLCFALQTLANAYCLPGITACLLLGCGSWKLIPAPYVIQPVLAFVASAVFGLVTMTLLGVARRARHNKRADL